MGAEGAEVDVVRHTTVTGQRRRPCSLHYSADLLSPATRTITAVMSIAFIAPPCLPLLVGLLLVPFSIATLSGVGSYLSPTWIPLAGWPPDNAPCVSLARMWSRVGHREIRQDPRLS